MKWKKMNDHYARSDTGYNITIGQDEGVAVHCAITPDKKLIKCFRGKEAKRKAVKACDQHEKSNQLKVKP